MNLLLMKLSQASVQERCIDRVKHRELKRMDLPKSVKISTEP